MTFSLAPSEIVKRLRVTFESGRTRPLEWRLEQLDRMAAMLREQEHVFLGALAADLGKPAIEAWATEVGYTLGEIRSARQHLPNWVKATRVATPLAAKPGHADLVPEPLGVALIIAPWNYPLQLLLAPMVGAIAAGNTVLAKPSEITPHVAQAIADLVPRYLDTEAITVVQGGPEETQALLAERYDHIFYTGNGRVGRIVMAAAAQHLTPVTLELGGKSPVIVHRSADVRVAARRVAWGKFLNAGQTCIAPDYVLVDASLEWKFLDELTAAIAEFYGSDPALSPDYGRIVNQHHFDRVMRLVDSGDVVMGGTGDADLRYIAPTVLRDVDWEAPAMQEEIFGPVLPVIAVHDLDEAIAAVNQGDKPLALYVFANDQTAIDAVLARTSSGGVCVNHVIYHVTVPDLPLGGVGESGMGRYHGRASFDTFTHYKPVLSKPARPDLKAMYPPFSSWKASLIRRIMR